ncbi:MAG: hypothetical protein ACRERV_07470 [Methylococcales bacterium]
MNLPTIQSTQNTGDTEKFFTLWAIYERAIRENYRLHRQVADYKNKDR